MIRTQYKPVQLVSVQLALISSSPQARANLRAFLFGATIAAVFQLLFGSPVMALNTVATQVCTWGPAIGGVGTALALVAFIAGIAMIAFGNRDGTSRAVFALVGALALFSGTQIFNTLAGNCGTGG